MSLGWIMLIALLSAVTTAGAMYVLWRLLLMPDLQRRARELAQEATVAASAELTAAAEAMVPQFRQAIRDGIQDAVLSPPTDRLSQTARGMTSAGVNVVEASLRRIFGAPTDRGAAAGAPLPADQMPGTGSGESGEERR